ncbi:MAG: hypothetical protein E7075_00385 [Bacteroidales bacterium]|nr:hypothetical protein [Bacteroidales bacterium]
MKRDWVITDKGKVVRRDKAKKSDCIGEQVHGRDNSFPDKEAAYACRDAIIDELPIAFMDTIEPKQDKTDMPRKKIVTQDDFREMIRKEVIERIDIFWENWAKLQPKDKCDLYYKMFAYAYSKAPVEKATDSDSDKRKLDKKKEADANRIHEGLPTDTNFEDE